MPMIAISDEQVLELVRGEVRAAVAALRPLLREEILKSMQLVDEEGALAILPIKGKQPRRTFRRLANKHRLEYVRIDGFKWWKLGGIQELIEKHTIKSRPANHANKREYLEAVA